ncbi:MAG TPA: hypothetical protein VHE61_06530 [Opitutaceae bacterium]|nr:hypothetical protein [Opitutaceae bacterium]
MKSPSRPFRPSLLVFLTALALVVSGCASNPTESPRNGAPVELQVQVQVPANTHPLRSQDIEDAFGDRIATALHEQGFHGRIAVLWDSDTPTAGIPLLAVNLLEWRVDPTGSVDCTFGAQLQTSAGRKSLGLFTGTSLMTWADRDWFLRANDFQDAAGTAMSDLWDRMQRTGLLPPPTPPPATNTAR